MKYKLLIAFALLTFLFLSGCYCREYASQDVCVKFEEQEISCLSKVIYYLPYNYTGEIDIIFDSNDLCYDFETDPEGYREEVKKALEEHPNDWIGGLYGNGTEYDPVLIFIYENITEIRKENVFNKTKLMDVCVETETRQVCVR